MSYIAKIQSLIDKQDAFEIVVDRIVDMLVAESASQQALATAAAEDPDLWAIRVYRDRVNPWESWTDGDLDQRPIVNVAIESAALDTGSSDVSRSQRYRLQIAIDVYGRGVPRSDGGGGHVPGDLDAALQRDRGVRLVRNMIAASVSVYLGLRGTVHGGPLVSGLEFFAPTAEDRHGPAVRACRVTVGVDVTEMSPQYEPQPLEYTAIDILEYPSGDPLAAVAVDYTA